MRVRDHVVAVANVEYIARVMRPANGGGEMEIVGRERQIDTVRVVVPSEGGAQYLVAFLNTQYGHWGLIDGARFRLVNVSYDHLDGVVVKETY